MPGGLPWKASFADVPDVMLAGGVDAALVWGDASTETQADVDHARRNAHKGQVLPISEVIIVGDAHNAEPGTLRHSLGELAAKIAGARSARAGDIVLRLSGKEAGTYRLSSGQQGVQVFDTAGAGTQPLIEVTGDAEAIQSVIDGKVDARKQFLAGGIRVRGDLRLLSDLALEVGLLKHPL